MTMNMQQIMMQAQKMQREIEKKRRALMEKEFSVSKGGAIKVTVLGNRQITALEIDEEAFDKDNKEMIEEMIALAINEAMNQIDEEEAKISSSAAGGLGLGF